MIPTAREWLNPNDRTAWSTCIPVTATSDDEFPVEFQFSVFRPARSSVGSPSSPRSALAGWRLVIASSRLSACGSSSILRGPSGLVQK